ncbi:MAG: 2-amino-4-hydroxy-6-hydroxymethyldihydropteridine diphosphokinase [Alphaproteobacteria bacterium]
MILIAFGGNLPHAEYGSPRETIEAALGALRERGVSVLARSRWYSTAPVPPSDQQRFVNLVAWIDSALPPGELLALLHDVEEEFGRVRGARNAARVLDIDLLDYNGAVCADWPELPHPRMSERAFVLVPLRDVAPDWRHLVSGASVDDLIAAAPDLSGVELMDKASGP